MLTKRKIDEVKKSIRKSIKNQTMYIENEPDFSGHPKNTIIGDKEENRHGEKENNIKNITESSTVL